MIDQLKENVSKQENLILGQQAQINTLRDELESHQLELDKLLLALKEAESEKNNENEVYTQLTKENNDLQTLFNEYQDYYQKEINVMEQKHVGLRCEIADQLAQIDKNRSEIHQFKHRIKNHFEEKETEAQVLSEGMQQNKLNAHSSNELLNDYNIFGEHMEEGKMADNQNINAGQIFQLDSSQQQSEIDSTSLMNNSVSVIKKNLIENQIDANCIPETIVFEPQPMDQQQQWQIRQRQKTMKLQKNTINLVMESAIGLPSSNLNINNGAVQSQLQSYKQDDININLNQPDQREIQQTIAPLQQCWTEIICHIKDKSKGNDHRKMVIQRISNEAIQNGIPNICRPVVWEYLTQNQIKMNMRFYNKIKEAMLEQPNPVKVQKQIESDLKRTCLDSYPVAKSDNKNIQSSSTKAALYNLMEMFHYFKPDVGYVQGLNYVGVVLLCHFDEYAAFKTMVNMILKHDFLLCIYRFNIKKIEAYFRTFDYFLFLQSPKLSRHFATQNLKTDVFYVEWSYTLFARAFPFSTVQRIWDLFFLHGEISIMKVILSIFALMEEQLLNCDMFEDSMFLVRNFTGQLNEKAMLSHVQTCGVNEESFYKVLKNMQDVQAQLIRKDQSQTQKQQSQATGNI